jgi:hypothetical protein
LLQTFNQLHRRFQIWRDARLGSLLVGMANDQKAYGIQDRTNPVFAI